MVEEELPLLTLEEHLQDLKKRIIKSLLVFLLAILVSFAFSDNLYDFLARPLLQAMSNHTNTIERKLIFTGITEAFMTHMKLSLFVGFGISFPYFLSQFYGFIAPGLYKKEKKILLPFVVASFTLFILGLFIAYYFVAPLACQFFLTFENTLHFQNSLFPVLLEARVSEYLNSIIQLTLSFGLVFQLPIVLFSLSKLGWLKVESLIRYRRQAIIINFIIAAIITPPDVLSQISLALPMVVLYEFSIFLIKKL